MSEAKDKILTRIRRALAEVPDTEKPEDVKVERRYRQKGDHTPDKIVRLFAERVGEYKATVNRVKENELKEVITESCRRENVQKLVVPQGFPKDLLPGYVTTQFDDAAKPLSHQELDESDGVITACAFVIAQTGTIILDAGEGQGRRALTLVPDYHLCIVRENQIVELVPEGFSAVEASVKKEGKPITLISGPSATSDIELSRVEGVHGPRRLEVLIISSAGGSIPAAE